MSHGFRAAALAGGLLLALGGPAPAALAGTDAPPGLVLAHGDGDGHQPMPGMDHSQHGSGTDMPDMPGMNHSDHGAGMQAPGTEHVHQPGMDMPGTTSAPNEPPRTAVLGGFAAVNGSVLAGAWALRRRGAAEQDRRRVARAAALAADSQTTD